MKLLAEQGEPGVATNICTGHAYKIQEVLDMLIEISGMDVNVVSDPALMRVADEPLLLGDNSRISALGFKPRYTLRETLQDVFEDWMRRI